MGSHASGDRDYHQQNFLRLHPLDLKPCLQSYHWRQSFHTDLPQILFGFGFTENLDDYRLFLGDAAIGLTVEAMHLLDVHHRLSFKERSSLLVDSVTQVCVTAAAYDDCNDGNHYRYCVVILARRMAL